MRPAVILGLLALLGLPAFAQQGDETVASLHATFRLLDADGQPIERAGERQTTRLSLELTDAQTG
ncbi:hypothetical protein [Xaviernesmea oryzae]|uniref:hypothetical protein n=1 Tax=Xaviernesmea oryzae TaxID=464029 RepID=UPI000A18CFE3|nr:hypothetical protein [Xaviernesmea oryzae]